jgi:hypothetical protein
MIVTKLFRVWKHSLFEHFMSSECLKWKLLIKHQFPIRHNSVDDSLTLFPGDGYRYSFLNILLKLLFYTRKNGQSSNSKWLQMNYWWLQNLPCRWDSLHSNEIFLACTWQVYRLADQKPADLHDPGRLRPENLGRCCMESIPCQSTILPVNLQSHKDVKLIAKKTNLLTETTQSNKYGIKWLKRRYISMRFDLVSVMTDQEQ